MGSIIRIAHKSRVYLPRLKKIGFTQLGFEEWDEERYVKASRKPALFHQEVKYESLCERCEANGIELSYDGVHYAY